jgi:hypothetical protein
MEETEIINKVANSGLVTLDIADYYVKGERVLYDLKQNLFMEAILREKDFREFLKQNDWSFYKDKHVAITCSVDTIIPAWAYMLLATKISPFASTVIKGDLEALESYLFSQELAKKDFSIYRDVKIVIKGCGDLPIPDSAYLEITQKLLPYAASIMFGEPCSTVPVYKRGK